MNCGAATDTGLLRDRNEDRYWIDPERGIFLVVDGVGGHNAGEIAAETAVEEIRAALLRDNQGATSKRPLPEGRGSDSILSRDRQGAVDDSSGSVTEAGMPARAESRASVLPGYQPRLSPSALHGQSTPPASSNERASAEERVRSAIARANNRIFQMAQSDGGSKGMACVLTLALVENGEVTIGHVGDSRLYLVWNGAIRKLTSDHSPVGEEEDAGELTEQEAMRHPRRNEVFRDVGSRLRSGSDEEFVEIRTCRLRADAGILLCSDGLTDQLTAARVREIVDGYDGDAERVARELVEAANAAGGRDNATALFAAGPEFRGRADVTRPRLGPTRIRMHGPARLLTGRAAFLAYGLLIGMLVWAALRAALQAIQG